MIRVYVCLRECTCHRILIGSASIRARIRKLTERYRAETIYFALENGRKCDLFCMTCCERGCNLFRVVFMFETGDT